MDGFTVKGSKRRRILLDAVGTWIGQCIVQIDGIAREFMAKDVSGKSVKRIASYGKRESQHNGTGCDKNFFGKTEPLHLIPLSNQNGSKEYMKKRGAIYVGLHPFQVANAGSAHFCSGRHGLFGNHKGKRSLFIFRAEKHAFG